MIYFKIMEEKAVLPALSHLSNHFLECFIMSKSNFTHKLKVKLYRYALQ